MRRLLPGHLDVVGYESSADSDDRLAASVMGRVECRWRLREWTHRSDDRTQPPVPEPSFQSDETGAIGFDDEEDRPPVLGKRRGGSAMVTRAPPERTSVAERSRISPPITSNTASTSPMSSSRSCCRSRNTSAPRPSTVSLCRCGRYRSPGLPPRVPVAPRSNRRRPRLHGSGRSARSRDGRGRTVPAMRSVRRSARAAATVWSMPADSGARLRASTATYSASVPLRAQSVSPKTLWPTVRPVVP